MEKLLAIIQENIYEKKDVFNLTMLAMLAGESIFLLGRPGVAKSLIARRIKYVFPQANHFEYLMNRFSTPEEIFGPISLTALQKGSYTRNVARYLPSADIAFLDEIWKASPSIQNTLLTIINEKIFRNGGDDIKVPLKLLISASNELPAKGEGLEALFDRFILRYIVEGVQQPTNFKKLIMTKTKIDVTVPEDLQIKAQEYKAWTEAYAQITVPDLTYQFIHNFRERIHELTEGIAYISDRRWVKIVNLMKVSAFFNGRSAIDKADWLIIAHCIWDDEEQYRTYLKLFYQFYESHLVREFDVLREQLVTELENLKAKINDIQDQTIVPQIYRQPFAKKLRGTYLRLIDQDFEQPICFINLNSFEKIKKNSVGEALVYLAADLTNLATKKKITFRYLNDSSLENVATGYVCHIEIMDADASSGLEALQVRINEINEEMKALDGQVRVEHKRLKKVSAIFTPEMYKLILEKAFITIDDVAAASTDKNQDRAIVAAAEEATAATANPSQMAQFNNDLSSDNNFISDPSNLSPGGVSSEENNPEKS